MQGGLKDVLVLFFAFTCSCHPPRVSATPPGAAQPPCTADMMTTRRNEIRNLKEGCGPPCNRLGRGRGKAGSLLNPRLHPLMGRRLHPNFHLLPRLRLDQQQNNFQAVVLPKPSVSKAFSFILVRGKGKEAAFLPPHPRLWKT